ncbi:IMPACT family protein [Salsipaludibacter albus]|uniref:IMPACT family protein n=1 Tax=Salsipaludibacter albus TaxID=2849650 RepID=UPI001EE4AA6D|nr:YigZ family protein [Salsipaludibacter albus]
MTDPPDAVPGDLVRTVAGEVRVQLDRIRGSRFVGDLAPVADVAAARAFVARVRAREPDASHHCWAWRGADGTGRSDDDGEPGGTAGPPMLRHLDGADLVDVVVVATRWFGGTKLGSGGLVRAYGDTAATAIAAADVRTRRRRTRLAFVHDWDLTSRVEAVVAAHDTVAVSTDYGARVHRLVAVPTIVVDDFVAALAEATSGAVVARTSPAAPDGPDS